MASDDAARKARTAVRSRLTKLLNEVKPFTASTPATDKAEEAAAWIEKITLVNEDLKRRDEALEALTLKLEPEKVEEAFNQTVRVRGGDRIGFSQAKSLPDKVPGRRSTGGRRRVSEAGLGTEPDPTVLESSPVEKFADFLRRSQEISRVVVTVRGSGSQLSDAHYTEIQDSER